MSLGGGTTGVYAIRFRLIAIMIAILAVAFATTTVIGYRFGVRELRRDILERELPLVAAHVESLVSRRLDRLTSVTAMLSVDPTLHAFLSDPTRDPTALVTYLGEVREQTKVADVSITAAGIDRHYSQDGYLGPVQQSAPDDRWYFAFIASGRPYEVAVGPHNDGRMLVFVNQRIWSGPLWPDAVVAAGASIDGFEAMLTRHDDKGDRRLYFVNADGAIVTRSAGAPDGAHVRDIAGLAEVAGDLLGGAKTVFEYHRGNETLLTVGRAMPLPGWFLIVEQDESTAIAPLREAALMQLSVGGSAVVLVGLVLAAVISHFQRKLEAMATQDRLTGLGNRHHFDLALSIGLRGRRHADRGLALLIFDIDHFKSINDRFGHLNGDKAIRALADAVRAGSRASDLICRWGGEEIAVLARDCAPEQALALGEKLRIAVAETPLDDIDPGLRITISAGIAIARHGEGEASLIARADAALYTAKESGRNRCVLTD